MTFLEAKCIPIIDYLERLGLNPVRKNSVDYWYYSPFRNEREASFKVNIKMNVWFDHGCGEGGTILDLGSKLHSCTIYEFTQKLSAGNYSTDLTRFSRSPSVEPSENAIYIIAVKELTNIDLLYYLQQRGIESDIATKYCKEVEFRIRDKQYRAIGFINKSGGYELRNAWLKRSSSPKDISLLGTSRDISLIENNPEKLCVLEGFIDFLSLIRLDHVPFEELRKASTFMVLNSISFLPRYIDLIKSFVEINLFLDNDKAGQQAKENLKLKGVHFYDTSIHYRESKDLNEHLVAKSRQSKKAKGKSH